MRIPYDDPKTWKHAKARIRRSRKRYEQLINKQVKRMRLGALDRDRFKALSGCVAMPGKVRNSDLEARAEFAEYVAREVRALSEEGGRAFFHITLLADEGIMSLQEPEMPLRRLRGKAFRAMQTLGLDGFYAIEVQALTNWSPSGTSGCLLAHVHMCGWSRSDDKAHHPKQMTKALIGKNLRSNAAWTSLLGARPAVITPLDARFGCPSYAAAYMLKLPHSAKIRVMDKSTGRCRLKSIEKGYRPNVAMRIHELFSKTLLGSHVGGVGEGAGLIKRCKDKAQLRATRRREARRQDGRLIEAFDEEAFWVRTCRKRTPEHKPAFVDGPRVL